MLGSFQQVVLPARPDDMGRLTATTFPGDSESRKIRSLETCWRRRGVGSNCRNASMPVSFAEQAHQWRICTAALLDEPVATVWHDGPAARGAPNRLQRKGAPCPPQGPHMCAQRAHIALAGRGSGETYDRDSGARHCAKVCRPRKSAAPETFVARGDGSLPARGGIRPRPGRWPCSAACLLCRRD